MTMKPKQRQPIRAAWDSYVEDVLADANIKIGSKQYVEARRAFYSGAWVYQQLAIKLHELDEADALAAMDQMLDELRAFQGFIGSPEEKAV